MKFVKFKKVISVFISSVLALQFSCVDKFCYATKNEVNVLYTTDDGYFGPTLVSMQSALDRKSTDTFYNFHIMVDGKFSNQTTLHKFANNNKERCKVTTYDMGTDFASDWTSDWPPSMYYRLKAASVLKDINKCIYIDGDTLINGDLNELYGIDLEDNHLGGIVDAWNDRLDIPDYINSGVALMNLKKIRVDGKEEELLKKVSENNTHHQWWLPDQDIWNLVFRGHIKMLSIKYNFMTNLFMNHTRKKYPTKYSPDICLREQNNTDEIWGWSQLELEKSCEPTIVHFVSNKPWKADCGVVNKGKNREVFEALYQKWHETATKVQTQYEVSFSKKKSKTGIIGGLGALAVGLLVATGGIIAKKTYDKKHNKIGRDNKPNLANAS